MLDYIELCRIELEPLTIF